MLVFIAVHLELKLLSFSPGIVHVIFLCLLIVVTHVLLIVANHIFLTFFVCHFDFDFFEDSVLFL